VYTASRRHVIWKLISTKSNQVNQIIKTLDLTCLVTVVILTLHVARLGAPRYVYHLPHLHSFNNQASTSLTISDVLERVFTTADDVLSPRRRFLVEQWTVSPNSLLLSYGCLPMVALCYLLLHSVALCYLLLHIGEEHALYIYHDLVSLAGQVIHPSIHSFIL
jgi:hypothetical protein